MGDQLGVGKVEFALAKPVWPKGREREMNLMVGFRTAFEQGEQEGVCLRIAASTLYRFFVNGRFVGYGPARGPHGYYRVDEWDLRDNLVSGENIVAIEVVGHNVNSYYVLDQPSFLQAEIIAGDEVLAATSGTRNTFDAYILNEKVQKMQRYSFQRAFVEAYRFWPGFDKWRSDGACDREPVLCAEVGDKALIPRGVPVPTFDVRYPIEHVFNGSFGKKEYVKSYWKDRSLVNISSIFKGFKEDELEMVLSNELQEFETTSCVDVNETWLPNSKVSLEAGTYAILDFGVNLSGFIGVTIKCTEDTRLIFVFDEVLSGKDVDFKRLGCVNAISCEMPAGTYGFESFEPYAFKYLKIMVLKGKCEVSDVYLREFANSSVTARFECSDVRLNRIFEAGVETFKQNSVDVFTDCPSRERAGWLCDSFFTARVEYDLTGDLQIERNFFENFLLPEEFPHLPAGMLPMCYPSDHNDGNFIPNWAMWFVVELEEYLNRTNDRPMVDGLKPKVLSLFDYFEPFRNEYGLLENLEKWVFIEWSEANKFTQDVNYPTNMLYAAALACAGRMYALPDFIKEADNIRQVIREQSFDGEFFRDNAVRKDGVLEVTENKTEICQYYAFFTEVATIETHPTLWKILLEKFGPARKQTGEFPDVHMANAFIGNYLRLELLSRYGHFDKLRKEIVDFFLYMAEQTGTLWENVTSHASCNHGFASHVVHWLYRDILGVREIARADKVVKLMFPDIDLEWCKGEVPVGSSKLMVKWWKQDGVLNYTASVPEGFKVEIENRSDMELKKWQDALLDA